MGFTMSDLGRIHAGIVGEVDAAQFTATVIGMQLRAMRERTGLSQAEVAHKAKTRPEVLSRLENGHGNPTVELVERIVRALKSLSA